MDVKEEHRNSLLAEVFKADAEIMKLQDQIRSLLQRAVDMDFERLGYIDRITMDSVETFKFAISMDHTVYPREYFADDEETYHPPEKEQVSDAEPRYVTYARVGGQEKDTVLEGDDLGELMAKWQAMEQGRDAEHRIGYVFVIDNNADAAHLTRKYEITTGRDVTPVYLKFPEMSGEDTEQVTQWLKANGASYDGKKNLWYVAGQDKNRFVESFRQYIQDRKKTEPGKNADEKKYYSYAYNADGSLSRFTGNSIEAVARHWREASPEASGRGKNDMTAYFYVREKNTATGQLGEASRYETVTGRDVTPVYLSLPHMSREDFAKTTRYLKDNGAKFNTTKKSWYVTRDQDLSKFAKFMNKDPAASRESTIRKLEDGKREAAGQARSHPAVEKDCMAVR